MLLYGSETRIVTNKVCKCLIGVTQGYLYQLLKLAWRHISGNYGDIPKVSDEIRKRRLQFAGHYVRSSWLVVSDLVLWKPMHGKGFFCEDQSCLMYIFVVCTPDKHQLKSRSAWWTYVSGEPSLISARCRRSEGESHPFNGRGMGCT